MEEAEGASAFNFDDSFVSYLLSEYKQVLHSDLPLSDNGEFMKLIELKFLLKNLRELSDIQLYQAYSKAETVTAQSTDSSVKKSYADTKLLAERIKQLDVLLSDLSNYINGRILKTKKLGLTTPRIVQLCEKYRFTKNERDIFHLMTVIQGSNDSHVLNTLIEEDYLRRVTGFQRMSGMSEVDIDIFCDGDRQHMKEGLVLVDEDNGTQFNLRIQRVAVQLLYGRKVKSDDILKISQTSLEEILSQEQLLRQQREKQQNKQKRKRKSSAVNKNEAELTSPGTVVQGPPDIENNPIVTQILTIINQNLANKTPIDYSDPNIVALVRQLEPDDRTKLLERMDHYATMSQNQSSEDDVDDDEYDDEEDGEDEEDDGEYSDDNENSNMDYSQQSISHNDVLSPNKQKILRLNTNNTNGSSNNNNRDDMLQTPTLEMPPPHNETHHLHSPKVSSLYSNIKLIRSNSWGPGNNNNNNKSFLSASKLNSKLQQQIKTPQSTTSKITIPDNFSEPEQYPLLKKQKKLDSNASNTTATTDYFARKSSDYLHNVSEYNDVNTASYNDDSSSVVNNDPETESKLTPYTSNTQLEYLEDNFQLVALMIKGNVARLKDDMKKEGTMSRYSTNWGDTAGEMKHSKRELAAKIRLQESRISMRVKKTSENGLDLPRLEVITNRFKLDNFEKKIVLLLIGKTVSPVVKTLMDTLDTSTTRVAEDVLTVGQALAILCQDFHSQISHRRYFYQSSNLLKNAVISLSKSKWHVGTGDLTENRIILDRRILDWVVGLDSEINELVEGSDLYEPHVSLSQVVLPTGYTNAILSQCSAYGEFQQYRISASLEKTLAYGNSLVILLCGKSGTGKTMTVNAIATELKKKVLLVDFSSLIGKKDSGSDVEVDLKGLFRESKMNNAVLFFDECEVIFKSRNMGSDRLLNSLLTEMERHEGIVFMATNRPYEIDEAMHRRINMVLEYREPDYKMRKQIWDNLLGLNEDNKKNVNITNIKSTSVQNDDNNTSNIQSNGSTTSLALHKVRQGLVLASDVETSVLAVKYELTGGFIKNAVMSALLCALSRNKLNPIITQDDLINGCKLQMRGNLTARNFEDRMESKAGLSHLFLTTQMKDVTMKIIRHEQSRSKVYGSWNIQSHNITDSEKNKLTSSSSTSSVSGKISHCEQKASIHLFAGTRGSGKTSLVKAIAYELGERRMKLVHVADFISMDIAEITNTFKTLVHDARLMDAIIVIDGFEHIMCDNSDGGGGGGTSKVHLVLSRIMDILYQYHGAVFLLCHVENPQNMMLQRDFASRLLTFLRFVVPPHDVRAQIWQSLMPNNAPLGDDINYEALGRRFEMNAGSIRSAIANATAEAAARDKKQIIQQKDLITAGDHEISKLKGGNFEFVSSLFA